MAPIARPRSPRSIPSRSLLGAVFRGRGVVSALVIAVAAPGCVQSEAIDPLVDCSTGAQNQRLLKRMREVYLWNDQIPEGIDPLAYESPAALLDAIRYEERDLWSHVSSTATTSAYYGEGKSVGLGLRWKFDPEGGFRVAMVYEGSAADGAGLARGDEVLKINGVDIATIEAEGRWATITGGDAEGVPVTLDVRKAGGAPETLSLQKRVYTVISVPEPRILDVDGRKIGYLLVDRFIGPTYAELRSAFAVLHEARVDDLIVDMRYNGGGYTDASRLLASLIGGKALDGEAYNLTIHNERLRDEDGIARFSVTEHQLNLSRVAVIATGSTASASELVINGLNPFIEVAVIGTDTYGKPVGSVAYEDCSLTVTPITFRSMNAAGEGGYYDGLPVDCPAEDQLSAPLGDPAEASVKEAIHWLMSDVDDEEEHTETCSAPVPEGAADASAARKPERRPLQLRGLQQEIGAF
ncbi:S41 family peptidase [Chondromyces apiculatus]|uniref:Carboxyl-terminal protease n=1 Tax=Chondromyces apiculatus DSM 436 TaxID=1192034 RepID=A0A017STX7_9BACT|nr:S41 family peptidase [Chondromyces apiculatus]EYF00227.1 Carboxyl-terminal protease [Chondromyces apiculatus DSM 436]